MSATYQVAIVGSGFAGSLTARVLTTLGYDVVLIERGTHPRFAIGESSTPLANLSLERIAKRYGLDDCYHLAAHGRWLKNFPNLGRGLKRGFTFYRHHPNKEFSNRGPDSERLLVAASPDDSIADSHWLRSDVDHHFVRSAIDVGVDYRDGAEIHTASFNESGVTLRGVREDAAFELRADFVIDASGPGGFLARQLGIPSHLERTQTRAGLVFSHFSGVQLMSDVVRGLPIGPYPDDWAAVHHVIDEGWMYSLRFDDGVTSAGFLLRPDALASLTSVPTRDASAMWRELLARYPTIHAAFAAATPLRPIAFIPEIQHRLAYASGERWLLMPHAFAFIDPLFSTGIAWSLRAVERIALAFESGIPDLETLGRYNSMLSAEADQIDLVVRGAYESMTHFDLFAAQSMLYFATVSYNEVKQRLCPDESIAWNGFLGVGDPVLEPLPRESLSRLTHHDQGFVDWITDAIAPRNIAGLGNPHRHNLYPVDFDVLLEKHALLGLSRDEMIAQLPRLRGMSDDVGYHDSNTEVYQWPRRR